MSNGHFEVNFSGWLQEGYELYKNNFTVIFLVNLIAGLIGGLTGGLLAAPMFAGVVMVMLALYDKTSPTPEVSMVFKGFNYFLDSFLLGISFIIVSVVVSLVLGVIPVIGWLASIFVSFALPTVLMFALFLIVDQKMEFWPAAMESINRVKEQFWPLLGLYCVTSIIGSVGLVFCFIGVFITFPFVFSVLTVAYRNAYPIENAKTVVTSPESGTMPPSDSEPTS